MPPRKKRTPRLGKLPPRFRFVLNPYEDARYSNCPICRKAMSRRKMPLVVHVEPRYFFALRKTSLLCTSCDLLIVHQDEFEHELVIAFEKIAPSAIGNPYLIIGTCDPKTWREGTRGQHLEIQNLLDQMADFREVLTLTDTGGWSRLRLEP